ncbi:type 1 glutamine amidotransferase [Pantoea ananatis]|uniref:type 1 glutamine amidotransferase n=1 Tax=Pantoea ananas TaxID=553 RepID=UPI0004985172|nr:type 1 glutamine amidotransferase [Pantoea ananatis]MDF7791701.1 type 1 glutamine amidotransferase [Pantoea ananatis]
MSKKVKIAFVDILDHPEISFMKEYKDTINQCLINNQTVDFLTLSNVDFCSLDDSDYDGFIISGSVTPYCSQKEWIVDLCGFIRRLYINNKVPLLGLCMAHELIAVLFGGLVQPGITKEIGTVELKKTPEGHDSPLLQGTQDVIQLLAAHSRDVVIWPEKATLLAGNARCQCQIFKLKNLYGIQSHPEVGMDAMKKWLRGREGTDSLIKQGFIDDENKLDQFLSENIKECNDRFIIFKNFIDICSEKKLKKNVHNDI